MEDVDRGAKVGLRWMNGPFEIMNAIGVNEAHRMAAAYANLAEFDLPPFFGIKAKPVMPGNSIMLMLSKLDLLQPYD